MGITGLYRNLSILGRIQTWNANSLKYCPRDGTTMEMGFAVYGFIYYIGQTPEEQNYLKVFLTPKFDESAKV